jgi:hypothetical protein
MGKHRVSSRLGLIRRCDRLQREIPRAGHIDCGSQWKATIAAHRKEIRELQAPLSRAVV